MNNSYVFNTTSYNTTPDWMTNNSQPLSTIFASNGNSAQNKIIIRSKNGKKVKVRAGA